MIETTHKPDSSPRQPAVMDSAYLQILAAEQADDRRILKWALAVAVAIHAVLLFVHLPDFTKPMEIEPAGKRKAYVVQQMRFRPPQAAPQRSIPTEKKRKIPVPDPTPDDPEPVREMEIDQPDIDLDLPVGVLNFDIPEGPPGPAFGADGVYEVGGEILPPVKIYAPRPGYTEEARQARIQGVTLIQAVIDTEGNVIDLKILKGLPMGLDRNALETVRQWKFEPATKNGTPVPVYYNVTVSFTLQ